jgi:hypothetical protein
MKLRRTLPILPILVTLGVGGSCAEIAAPSRNEAYQWRLFRPGAGTSIDSLSFHWPRSRLPVRIWTEDTLNLPAHVANGIALWKAAFLYGEFDAVGVSDSSTADVIVSAGSVLKAGFSVTRLATTGAPECEGVTEFELPADSREIQLPFRVLINPRFDLASPGMEACLALTTAHELGHAIGIFNHSPEPTDLMYSNPTVSVLSDRDRATAELVYHVEPNLSVTSR